MLLRLHHAGGHGAGVVTSRGPGEPRLGLTLAAASLGIFLIQMDFLALNLALPSMARDLDTTPTALQWVVSGYMLALAAFLVPGGRLGDIVGRRRMLMAGLAVFGVASLAGGLAPNAATVVACRIVQGVGAGVMFPLAVAVITDAYPAARTMRAIGNAYGIGAVAMALGPLVGGGLTEVLSWRVVLFVNVPGVLVALVVTAVGVRESRDTTVPRSVDLPGLVAVALGIATVTYAVDRAGVWSTTAVLTLAAVGLLLLVAFVLRERVAPWPLVALDLFRNAPYVVVTLMATVANIGFVVATFGTTIYLQQVEGYTALEAGLVFLAASIGCGAGGPLSGTLGQRGHVPRTIAVASLTGAVGLFVVSLTAGWGPYLVGLALMGLGYGVGWAMASVGTQTVVPAERAGQASGVTLAVVIGVAGLAVAVASALISTGDAGLGAEVEDLLRGLAAGTAVATLVLGLVASRVVPEGSRTPS